MSEPWQILMVDDDEDIHNVSKLALKHCEWRNKKFNLTSAYSAAEAKKYLDSHPPAYFQVALIDVVMETDNAGLELCEYVRATCSNSLRIILRTGQPGVAPKESVLANYDIDYYLAKSEATPERLYAIVRACLRSSQDISTLMAFGRQLQSFTRALQSVTSLDDLLVFMTEGLGFLELKHGATILFFYDLSKENAVAKSSINRIIKADPLKIMEALRKASGDAQNPGNVRPGPEFGLVENLYLLPFKVQLEADIRGKQKGAKNEDITGGICVQFEAENNSPKSVMDFVGDARLFIENWRIAYSTLILQQRLARERMLREQMFFERLQSIATMVTGVAHELNTPLGVANTAGSMVTSLGSRLVNEELDSETKKQIAGDMLETCDLLSRNLARAQQLIGSFKQLSASQLSDRRMECDVTMVIKDCTQTMAPALRKQSVQAQIQAPDKPLLWDGYPGHLTQVLVNFFQNALRYAYPESGGKIDIRIAPEPGEDGKQHVKIEFEDYGAGVPESIQPRLFEPFVTSGRAKGGTGLGLAITHNIVTNLLGGTISCDSKIGKGTKFTMVLPPSAPKEQTGAATLATPSKEHSLNA